MKRTILMIMVFTIINSYVFSQIIYERDINEESYDWTKFTNEFTTFDGIIKDLAGKMETQYYVIDLTFFRQQTRGIANYLAFNNNPDLEFHFRNGSVPFNRGDRVRVWFILHKALFGNTFSFHIARIEKL